MTAEGTTTSTEQEQQCVKSRKLSVADDTNYWELLKTRKHSQTLLEVIKKCWLWMWTMFSIQSHQIYMRVLLQLLCCWKVYP